jgi:hypothetical protein
MNLHAQLYANKRKREMPTIQELQTAAQNGNFKFVKNALITNLELLLSLDDLKQNLLCYARFGNQSDVFTLIFDSGTKYQSYLNSQSTADAKTKLGAYYFGLAHFYLLGGEHPKAYFSFQKSLNSYNKALSIMTSKQLENTNELFKEIHAQIIDIKLSCAQPELFNATLSLHHAQIKTLDELETEICQQPDKTNFQQSLDSVRRLRASHHFELAKYHESLVAKFIKNRDYQNALDCGYASAINHINDAIKDLTIIGYNKTSEDIAALKEWSLAATVWFNQENALQDTVEKCIVSRHLYFPVSEDDDMVVEEQANPSLSLKRSLSSSSFFESNKQARLGQEASGLIAFTSDHTILHKQ